MALQTKPVITFDVGNPEHVMAIYRFKQTGAMDSRFRFHLEEGYPDVMTMVAHKMSEAFMENMAVQFPTLAKIGERKEPEMRIEGTVVSFRKPAGIK